MTAIRSVFHFLRARARLKAIELVATQEIADLLRADLEKLPMFSPKVDVHYRMIELYGWAAADEDGALDKRRLQALNPGLKIIIRRTIRRDLPLNRFGRNRTGFHLRASGPSDVKIQLPTTLDGLPFTISNSEALDVIAQVCSWTDRTDTIATGAYVDGARSYPISDPQRLNPFARWRVPSSGQLILEYPGAFVTAAKADSTRRLGAFGIKATENALISAGFLAQISYTAAKHFPRTTEWQPKRIVRFERNNSKRSGVSAQIPTPHRNLRFVAFSPSGRSLPGIDPTWHKLDSVYVQEGGVVVDDANIFVVEHAADPKHAFVSGQWQHVISGPANSSFAIVHRRPRGMSIERGVLLSGRNDLNWYHFVCEYLPRALSADRQIDREIPFLISSDTPASGKELLRAISDREIIEIDRAARTEVETLYVREPSMQVLDSAEINWADGVSANPNELRLLRDSVREIWSTNRPAGRFYLRRNSGHRRLLNDSRLARVAQSRGLTVVDPALMSVAEQMDLFCNAEFVTGAGGAVMANYLFLPTGSRVLAITSSPLWDFVLPAVICSFAGASFRYVLNSGSENTAGLDQRKMHRNFRVSERTFARALDQELRELTQLQNQLSSA